MPPSQLLGYGAATGNYKPFVTGGNTPIPKAYTAMTQPAALRSSISDTDRFISDSNASLANLLKQIQGLSAPVARPQIPYYDINAGYAKARSAAEQAVNPLYVKKLNDFLAQQQVKQTRAQQDTAKQQADLEEALKNTLEAGQIQQQRTGEDVATNLAQVANKEQQFQEDTGTAFDEARLAAAKAGNVQSGLDQQQLAKQSAESNKLEGRQGESFDVQKQAQQVFKSRTFEDIARTGALAGTKAAKGKEAAKIDLDRYIQDLGFEEQQTRSSLEAQRLQSVLAEQGNQYNLGLNRFISTLRNPEQIQLANQAYRF